ncbi:MAG: hypothetical protein A2Y33_00225 [Spirochaetes bacterium GWF1_51_8]|nr:MAG: hypothetical protein A2Y33_00225 [Spirochaetes bacterium GWF1_51_8]
MFKAFARVFRNRSALTELIILTLISSPFLILGLTGLAESMHIVNTYRAVQGTVVTNEILIGHKNTLTYAPVVEFTVWEDTYSFKDPISTYPQQYYTGDHVKVRFDPKNPETAIIEDWGRLWLIPLVLNSLGLFLFLLGVFIALNSTRK